MSLFLVGTSDKIIVILFVIFSVNWRALFAIPKVNFYLANVHFVHPTTIFCQYLKLCEYLIWLHMLDLLQDSGREKLLLSKDCLLVSVMVKG